RINAYIEEEVQRRLLQVLIHTRRHFLTSRLFFFFLIKLPLQHLLSRPLVSSGAALQEPVRVTIPRYVLRGQGKDEHFEYEVKISVMDETWTVFRRYSRFREMHFSLKMKYPELAALEFPPKKLFGNRDERMVAERRCHLEAGYSFTSLVMMSSTSSPLRNNTGFCLSKHTVCEFSPFFKKGVFEYGSHGTG
uniref:PX domain-containing protein n=1 Tax=Cynoglossus semilaevis TaxID=244447 RepID=A0A3P8UNA0_CYNSE